MQHCQYNPTNNTQKLHIQIFFSAHKKRSSVACARGLIHARARRVSPSRATRSPALFFWLTPPPPGSWRGRRPTWYPPTSLPSTGTLRTGKGTGQSIRWTTYTSALLPDRRSEDRGKRLKEARVLGDMQSPTWYTGVPPQ